MKHRFPLPPSANRYWRYVRGRVVVSAEAAAYKYTIAMLARCSSPPVVQLAGPVTVTVAIYRARKAGDLDNFCKILLDALQGSFYRNDSQIRELHASLHEDRHDPRCEVSVTSCIPG